MHFLRENLNIAKLSIAHFSFQNSLPQIVSYYFIYTNASL